MTAGRFLYSPFPYLRIEPESSPHSRVRELASVSQERGINVGTTINSTVVIKDSRSYSEAVFCFSVTFHSLFEYWSVDLASSNSSSTREYFSTLNTTLSIV